MNTHTSSLESVNGLKPYLRNFYERALKDISIHGSVFIVGGTEYEAIACLELGAKEIIVANPWFSAPWYKKNIVPPNIRLDSSFAENINIEPESIDVVLSCCAIEHILNIPAVLDKIYDVLKPGCHAFINGSPIWTGPCGHHLWFSATDGTRYFFNGSGDKQPVQNWWHLLFPPEELEKKLSDVIPLDHANGIVHYIHFSDNLNRLSPSQIENMCKKSSLNCLSFRRTIALPAPKSIANSLRDTYTEEDLGTSSIDILFQKEPSEQD